MGKKKISGKPFVFPMPTTIVGANVNGKPTFMTIAFCNMISSTPPIFGLASTKTHYTNIGIKENQTFSVNIPSTELVKATDYCGLVSGHKTDKSTVFSNFYGELKTAPMIEECPLTMECKLVKTVELGKSYIFFGEVVAGYADEHHIIDDSPDLKKIDPIIYSCGDNYWRLGEYLAKAFNVGKNFK